MQSGLAHRASRESVGGLLNFTNLARLHWWRLFPWILSISFLFTLAVGTSAQEKTLGASFEVSFPASVRQQPITGRIFVFIGHSGEPELRLQDSPQFFAIEANQWKPDQVAVIDEKTLGYPFRNLKDVPAGDYYVQAFANVYVEYPRADGHVIWGLDQWNGQDFTRSPGNLYSKTQKVHLDARGNSQIRLNLTEFIPPVQQPADTEWVKYIKIESKLLSRFWGRPMYLGAIVLLPRGYSSQPEVHYPAIYYQKSHYLRDSPFGFSTENPPETEEERRKRENLGYETGYEFYKAWSSDHFPQMIAVTFLNPTPYYDFSSAMNSDNNGPYGDAIMTELIPYIEERFRIIREPYARVLVGKSSGGRDALALQLFHPNFFGGAWLFYPWAFNYRRYFVMNIYETENAFELTAKEAGEFGNEWSPLERYLPRTTSGQPVSSLRQNGLFDEVQGGRSGVSAEWTGSDNALNSPVGDDGYPKPLFDKLTGKVDREVADHWRAHDLAFYLETNWAKIGPQLVGKLHFYVGDMDEWFRNYGVHDLEKFLEGTKNPYYNGSFEYGPLKGHLWQPMTNAELVKIVAAFVSKNVPKGSDSAWKLSRHLGNEGILVSRAGSVGHARKFLCVHVLASDSKVGYGVDGIRRKFHWPSAIFTARLDR
jgi:hypothetical protein